MSVVSRQISHISESTERMCPPSTRQFERTAIFRWLSSHGTEPATNEAFQKMALVLNRECHWKATDLIDRNQFDADSSGSDNLTETDIEEALLTTVLAASILDSEKPNCANESTTAAAVTRRHRNKATIDPTWAWQSSGGPALTNEISLRKILACKSAKPETLQVALPPAVTSAATGHTYEFGRDETGRTQVRVADDGEWTPVPHPRATSVFALPQGLVFFNPQDLHAVPRGPESATGRRAPRAQKTLLITRSPDLTPLAGGPVAVKMGMAPRNATHFSFQGEFVFFYVPYPGEWARKHFQMVTVHRFDGSKSRCYQQIGEYTLDGHYCNAAVGLCRYFILSWKSFEDEAMQEHWETRRDLCAEGMSLQAAEALRLQEEEAWRRELLAECSDLRDPIHVYARAGGTCGLKAATWPMILDYHKPARKLELSAPQGAGRLQRLRLTEGEMVFEFGLFAPEDLRSLGTLPIVPGRLCGGF